MASSQAGSRNPADYRGGAPINMASSQAGSRNPADYRGGAPINMASSQAGSRNPADYRGGPAISMASSQAGDHAGLRRATRKRGGQAVGSGSVRRKGSHWAGAATIKNVEYYTRGVFSTWGEARYALDKLLLRLLVQLSVYRSYDMVYDDEIYYTHLRSQLVAEIEQEDRTAEASKQAKAQAAALLQQAKTDIVEPTAFTSTSMKGSASFCASPSVAPGSGQQLHMYRFRSQAAAARAVDLTLLALGVSAGKILNCPGLLNRGIMEGLLRDTFPGWPKKLPSRAEFKAAMAPEGSALRSFAEMGIRLPRDVIAASNPTSIQAGAGAGRGGGAGEGTAGRRGGGGQSGVAAGAPSVSISGSFTKGANGGAGASRGEVSSRGALEARDSAFASDSPAASASSAAAAATPTGLAIRGARAAHRRGDGFGPASTTAAAANAIIDEGVIMEEGTRPKRPRGGKSASAEGSRPQRRIKLSAEGAASAAYEAAYREDKAREGEDEDEDEDEV
jgi:hypothetical protein